MGSWWGHIASTWIVNQKMFVMYTSFMENGDDMNSPNIIVLILVVMVAECGSEISGCSSGTTYVLHPGEVISGTNIGFCKVAWKDTRYMVFGRPLDTSTGSQWGTAQELVNRHLMPCESKVYPGIRYVGAYVHPDEGPDASDEVHRAAWIRIEVDN